MNERIQEIVYKADDVEILPDEDFCDTDFLADMDPRRVKVFAELIVKDITAALREIAKHQEVTGSEPVSYSLRQIASSIEFQYGVEQ